MLTLTHPVFQTSHFKKGLVFAIAAHLIWAGWIIYQPKEISVNELMPPPAVMMELSLLTEAIHQVQKQPIGIEQQLSVASRQQESAINEVKAPELIKDEQAQILVHEPKKQKKNHEEPKKTPPVKRQQVEEQESEKSQSSAASVSSTATSANLTSRVAASYDSDSDAVVDADAAWRAEVIGHLNRYKRYPEDAQRRNRIGRPTVRFTIDKQGYVTNSVLVHRSGTHSLDREAKQVLARAQPLPAPPDIILNGGEITIELPIDFSLIN
ncbi:transport protein TonB [Photorhabdus australis subsp. thailandensis]|uniref:Transport protein TonB n=1 Tax=Photorhabdus australis subsp. thailandensis TaxID=2805096 RepID=A0A1C0U4J4_9GAMM|nr:energy transducer TonB [Photorhabdus australis]OCQ52815.1 transport protein TonB [Photorhabdus australis subsp. thailandensis]